jgi:pimeloyl-ACP methyl ester carboxylesterase
MFYVIILLINKKGVNFMLIKKILILLLLFITFSMAADTVRLKSGETKFGIADKHTYSYYKIDALKGDTVTIALSKMDADGDLYVRIGATASREEWDCKSHKSKLKDEECSVTLQEDNTVYISVYADKCIRTVEHHITAEITKNDNLKLVERFPKSIDASNKFVTYTPPNGINNSTPVVLFLNGFKRTLDKYDGIMHFLSNQGYFVIGVYSNSYNPEYSKDTFERIIKSTQKYSNLKLNKLAIMGHSLGGGNSFYLMKYFQDLGYGKDGSLVLSFEGWFPFAMKQNDFKQLYGHIAFLQMNGKKGTDDIDPLMSLSIWNLAKNSQKFFLTLPQNNHLYIEGDRDSIVEKHKLLDILAKLMHDAFTKSSNGYNAISLDNKATYDDIYKMAKQFRHNGCDGRVGNAIDTLNSLGNDIDYCSPEQY